MKKTFKYTRTIQKHFTTRGRGKQCFFIFRQKRPTIRRMYLKRQPDVYPGPPLGHTAIHNIPLRKRSRNII